MKKDINIQKGFEKSVDTLTGSIAHIIRYTGYKTILMLGRMSEIILLFTTSFIVIAVYAHSYLVSWLGNDVVSSTYTLSILSIVTLPEIVFFTAFKAMKDSLGEAKSKKDLDSILYAIGFTVATIAFLIMWGNALYIAGTVAKLSDYNIDSFWLIFRMSSVVIYVISSFLYQLDHKKELSIAIPFDLQTSKEEKVTSKVKVQKKVKVHISEEKNTQELLPETSSTSEETFEAKTSEEDQKILYIGSGRSTLLDNFLLEKTEEELSLLSSKDGRREREEIAQKFGKSETTVRNRLKVLQEKKA